VTLGMSAGGYVQVLAGLSEGQTVVTSSQFLIDSESNLKEALERMGTHDEARDSDSSH
jgi:membrane fusion protein, copper/silver efflux system